MGNRLTASASHPKKSTTSFWINRGIHDWKTQFSFTNAVQINNNEIMIADHLDQFKHRTLHIFNVITKKWKKIIVTTTDTDFERCMMPFRLDKLNSGR